VVKLLEELEKEGMKCVFIDCQRLSRVIDLVKIAMKELEERFLTPRNGDRESLEKLFAILGEEDVRVVAFDEFVFLVKCLSRREDYGNTESMVARLRALASTAPFSTVFTSSSLREVRAMMSTHRRVIARGFDAILDLKPLSFKHSVEFIKKASALYGIDIPEDDTLKMAIYGDEIPFYMLSLVRSYVMAKSADNALKEELTNRPVERS